MALLGVVDPERLPQRIRKAVETGPAYLSVISLWEVTIRSMRGNLELVNPQGWWPVTLESLGLRPILFRPEHVAAIQRLAPHHADPFDRAIVATAIAEELVVLTTDKGMDLYVGQGTPVRQGWPGRWPARVARGRGGGRGLGQRRRVPSGDKRWRRERRGPIPVRRGRPAGWLPRVG